VTVVFDSTDPAVRAWSGITGAGSGASGQNMWVMGGSDASLRFLNDTFNIYNF
jgi:hypothetical protein